MEHKIKLGNTIVFDSSREKDIIKGIEDLTEKRQLGKFIEEAIRLVYNNPREAKLLGFPYNTGEARQQFFDKVNVEMDKLADKLDKLYEQMLIVFIAQKLGSTLGLEERAENVMEASIEIERQIRALSDGLGLNASSRVFERNQNVNREEQADKVIEFIKDNYGRFVDSLAKDVKDKGNVVYVQAGIPMIAEPLNGAEPKISHTEIGNEEVIEILSNDKDKSKNLFAQLDGDEDTNDGNGGFAETADLDSIMAFMGD